MTLSILLVDDYDANVTILTTVLELRGHHVTGVNDGEPALRALKQDAYDLVITDDRMGRMNGFELATAIRHGSTQRDVPILLISAYEYGGALSQRMAEAGINGFLPRPFTFDQLYDAIEAVVKRPTGA